MQLKKQILQQGNFFFKHRSNIPILIVLLAFIVFVFQNKNINESDFEKIILVSIAFSFFGLIIRAIAVGFSASNTSGRNTKAGQVADSLNTTGIYSLVRHPLYIGNFFMWLGAAILTCNFWFVIAFILFYFFYYERIIFAEEHFLSNKFKNEFESWSDKTNIIFPTKNAFKKPIYKFDFLKVLTKEKNGFAAIFILIFLFKCLHNYFYVKTKIVQLDVWFYLLILSLLLYVLLKILKMQIKKRNNQQS